MKNIALIGMSGSYKTTIAKLVASELNMMAVDTDELIEFDAGISINEIFAKYGEKGFRSLEIKALRTALSLENVVISTGGGIIIDKGNAELLHSQCIVVYLYATPRTLANRLKGDNVRPLLAINREQQLIAQYDQRKELYESTCHIKINTNKQTSKAVAQALIDMFKCGCN